MKLVLKAFLFFGLFFSGISYAMHKDDVAKEQQIEQQGNNQDASFQDVGHDLTLLIVAGCVLFTKN